MACIMDCPTIRVYAGKWYKALIDSMTPLGMTALHLRIILFLIYPQFHHL